MNLTKKQTLAILSIRNMGIAFAQNLYDLCDQEDADTVLTVYDDIESAIDIAGEANGIDENDDPIVVESFPGRPPLFTNPRPSRVVE